MTKTTVGVDIAKDWLDAFRTSDRRTRRFANNPAGFRELIEWMGTELECVAYEPGGPWHRELEKALREAGVPLKRFNPYQVRCFARGMAKGGGRPTPSTPRFWHASRTPPTSFL